ncbi:arginine/ornithine antiporter ArcD [Halorhabdus amylolytica]|uniref:arginine/ornithine antiporter ArcD n=1 Tax=Halorhabdus amylolytica TaxID=2559573 RepID=UPI0010AA2B3F|nr:Na+/H+ antiporter NhaC [Halorhabdus amylolytica]
MPQLSYEPLAYEELSPDRRPTLPQAIVPIVVMLVLLSLWMVVLPIEEPSPHMPLLWSGVFTGLIGWYWFDRSWDELYDGIVDGLRMGMQAILILMIVYMLIAAWIAAGTIPTLIVYGLEILTPDVFLPVAAVLAFATAFTVGSSWTTAGTLGVAFIGIGTGLGIPEPMTAGAVLSGAYTGDKVSPLSDTTNLAAAVTNTDLMDHVSAMRVGTGLAFGIAVLAYVVLGLQAGGAIPVDRLETIITALDGSYAITPLTFVPVIVTFALALRGYPAIPSLLAGVFAGAATAVAVQGTSPVAVWQTIHFGTEPATGVKSVDGLLAADGLSGAMWVISLVMIALSLGGLFERTGVLAVLAHGLARAIQGVASLTIGTAISAFSMNVLAAEQYMSLVVPGLTLRNLYDEYDLDSSNLSRAIEAAGTTTSALVPWSTGGIYMAGVLGVPTVAYAPYYLLGFLSPLVLIGMGVTGWGIRSLDESSREDDGMSTVAVDVDDD